MHATPLRVVPQNKPKGLNFQLFFLKKHQIRTNWVRSTSIWRLWKMMTFGRPLSGLISRRSNHLAFRIFNRVCSLLWRQSIGSAWTLISLPTRILQTPIIRVRCLWNLEKQFFIWNSRWYSIFRKTTWRLSKEEGTKEERGERVNWK